MPIISAPSLTPDLEARKRRMSEMSRTASGTHPGRQRVLAIDDTEDTLELIRMSLSDEYDVVTTSNPMEVYELVELWEPDLLIIDIMMPRVTGFQLVEMLKRSGSTREIPVIILSAKDTARDIKHGYKLGASLYLTKPFQPERLVRNVKTQFELTPKTPRAKKLTLTQAHVQLQTRASAHGSTARLSSSLLDHKQPVVPKRDIHHGS